MSDAIKLSLAELEAHDPRHHGRGAEQRFLCPLPACADHQGRDHKNLAVNIGTGLWRCCRCEASGKLTEKWEPRERLSPRARARRAFGLNQTTPRVVADVVADHGRERLVVPERIPTWRRRWDQAVPVAGTPGAVYLVSRGISESVAAAADVRYLEKWGHWAKDENGAWQLEGTSRRVVFPIVDQGGELVGIQGRAIDQEHHGEKMLTNGSAGVFRTEVDLDSEQLAIVEAPIDALSLATVGVQALATQGTAWPDWLPRALAFKVVRLAHDADDAGDMAAAKMTPELRSWGAQVQRMRPEGAKDWNEILQQFGTNLVRATIADDAADVSRHVPNPGPQPEDDDEDQEDLPAAAVYVPMQQPTVPYAVVERPGQAGIDELLAWLVAAPRPAVPFQLWPWARVGDVERFYAALDADLTRGPPGPRWQPAVEDLRQLARLFGQSITLETAA